MSYLKILLFSVIFSLLQVYSFGQFRSADRLNPYEEFQIINKIVSLLTASQKETKETLRYLEKNWDDSYIPFLLDVLYLPGDKFDRDPVFKFLKEKTQQNHDNNIFAWLDWLWKNEENITSFHGNWMAQLYKSIDPKFEKYFLHRTNSATIRLDEVRWGGVVQDGIPPLRNPDMIEVSEAGYLKDDNIVFGISINGDHRAYPKRILAWHEMFVDKIGGENIAGVYCTLCGTVIAYNTHFDGTNHELGTSGFLYRSNKLMYDKATQSLWNTIEGKPVIGPLVDANIELKSHSVVTTTWGAWKKLHPDTKVLSLKTGHKRDYGEGVAYRDYFSTDRLMFNVPKLDNRLLNKDEVLIVRADGYQDDPLAISSKFLMKNEIYHDKIGETTFVVLTDDSGGNRVFESKENTFTQSSEQSLQDRQGNSWKITEEKLIATDGRILNRLPYHRIFWFAWFNTYEGTRLVK
ncbi:MAG: DUF3179 domain-containing protein [Chitinophagales bacterium]|nr:DUF3179 domain-containing protein [Chitinophagales bacterium]